MMLCKNMKIPSMWPSICSCIGSECHKPIMRHNGYYFSFFVSSLKLVEKYYIHQHFIKEKVQQNKFHKIYKSMCNLFKYKICIHCTLNNTSC